MARNYKEDIYMGVAPVTHMNATNVYMANGRTVEEAVQDYIVEEGTTEHWYYEKWNSGIAKLYGRDDASRAISTAGGSIYWGDTPFLDLPFPLLTIKSAAANILATSGVVWGTLSSIETTRCRCRLYSAVSGTYSIVAFYIIEGTWK